VSDHITLPRDVGERLYDLLLDRIDGVYHASSEDIALRDALDAALEEQEDEALLNEPVAMRYDGDGYGYLYIDSGSGSDWQRRHKDAEPLYAAPPQPDAKREPATDKQVTGAYAETDRNLLSRWDYFYEAWRAAERHHGITKEDGK
jgi:hypothetical protein